MNALHKNIANFFGEILNDLECQQDTKAYIIGIYGKYKTSQFDLSKDSATLLLAQARAKQDFLIYQNLGDWLFFSKSMFPESLKNASENYYDNVAKLSYYSCYRIIKTWRIYEELADEFVTLTEQIRTSLIKHQHIDGILI
jgi:hypothetical protein